MSKMDALRAMREANYKDVEARAAKPTATPSRAKPAAKKSAAKRAPVEKAVSDPEAEVEKLCGHRAISGRTCTREAGHAAKNHRYS